MRHRIMRRRIALLLSPLLAAPPAVVAQTDEAGAIATEAPPAWSAANPDGSRAALLEGDRSRPGTPYVYLVALPAGFDGHICHDVGAELAVVRGDLAVRRTPGTSAAPIRLAVGARTAVAAGRVLGLRTDRPAVIRISTAVPIPSRREPGAPAASVGHENRC